MCKNLTQLGVSCTLILDSAVGYVMEHVDMVMVGAEGVAESGGVINKVKDLLYFSILFHILQKFLKFPGWNLHNGSVRQGNEKAVLRSYREFQIF